jgi:D-alanyl-lipoteichoic acid acyltransferase DltB (MBOAT superfamily)
VFFAFQIYCDFSGYSDIAIGAAQVMGFKIMINFNRPYYSKSISEFWKRWHISLSTGFRDYFYISLGGSKVIKWRWYFNLFVTFLVSGLWHGAHWTFVIWGSINGFFLIFSIWTKETREKMADLIGITQFPLLQKYWQVFSTFGLICFAWIFFRAKNVSDGWYISSHLFLGFENIFNAKYLLTIIKSLGLSKSELILTMFSLIILEAVHLMQRQQSVRERLSKQPLWFRWLIYYGIIISIVYFGVSRKNDFIYFQF